MSVTVLIVVAFVVASSSRDDAVREAAFREALRVVKDERPAAPLRCLALENEADPSRAMLERLARHTGLKLFPYSECMRRGLLRAQLGSLEGPRDLVALQAIRWRAKQTAELTFRILGGTAAIEVTRNRKGRGWKAACCSGGIIG